MLDIFIVITEIIRVNVPDRNLGSIYSQAMNEVKYMARQYNWIEIHINLQGGELAFIPRHGFWL